MTPEEFKEEITGAAERLLDLMVQAKFATYMAERVPPVLDAIRANGSTLQIFAPAGHSIDQEFDVLGRVLKVARSWMPDHAVLGFDTSRVLDPARAPVRDDRTEDTLFEATKDWEGASPVILIHGYNGRDGATGEALGYTFDADGDVRFDQQRRAIDEAWLSWTAVASNMERFLLPGLVEMEDLPFDEEALKSHALGYAIFAVQRLEEAIFVQAWGDTYAELFLKPGLSRERIEEDIAGAFALTREAAAEADAGGS